MIKAYLYEEQKEWDLHLGCLARAYRATPNESTRLTPNLLTIGREVRLSAELVFVPNLMMEEISRHMEFTWTFNQGSKFVFGPTRPVGQVV